MKLLLDINEVADAIGVSRRTAYSLRSNPHFPKPVAVSTKCVRYKSTDLAAFVDSLAHDAAPATEPAHLKGSAKGRKASNGGGNGGTGGGRIEAHAAQPCTEPHTAEGSSAAPPAAPIGAAA